LRKENTEIAAASTLHLTASNCCKDETDLKVDIHLLRDFVSYKGANTKVKNVRNIGSQEKTGAK